MIRYRLSISGKPTLRLYRAEGQNRKPLAEVTGARAQLAKSILLQGIKPRELIRFRDGRVVLEVDEEPALRITLGLRALAGMRSKNRMIRILEAVDSMDRGELYWWHSLYLRRGDKAIRALRTTYL
jgi:hypothetical protein